MDGRLYCRDRYSLAGTSVASAAGIVGILVAAWGASLLGRNLQINGEPGFAIPLDARVLAFAAVAVGWTELAKPEIPRRGGQEAP